MLVRISRSLRRRLHGVRGTLVEAKRLTVSVHWRTVSPVDTPRFRRGVRQALAPWLSRRAIRVTRGKRVIEVRPPVAWGKGEAVRWLKRKFHGEGAGLIYLGDDRADEDVFRVVNQWRGVSVRVGPKGTTSAARWWLRDSGEVTTALARIADIRWANRLR